MLYTAPVRSAHQPVKAQRAEKGEQREKRADTEDGYRNCGGNIGGARSTEARQVSQKPCQRRADRSTGVFQCGDRAGGHVALALRRQADHIFGEERVAEAKTEGKARRRLQLPRATIRHLR